MDEHPGSIHDTVFRDRLHYLHSGNIVLDSFRTDLPFSDMTVICPPIIPKTQDFSGQTPLFTFL